MTMFVYPPELSEFAARGDPPVNAWPRSHHGEGRHNEGQRRPETPSLMQHKLRCSRLSPQLWQVSGFLAAWYWLLSKEASVLIHLLAIFLAVASGTCLYIRGSQSEEGKKD